MVKKYKKDKPIFVINWIRGIKIPVTKRRLKRAIIFTPVILIVGWLLVQIITTSATTLVADYKVKEARSINEYKYDQQRLDKIDMLLDSGTINSAKPQYSSKIDACYVTHSDRGWVAANWYQDCYIRYVDLLPTTLPRPVVEQRLNSLKNVNAVFGEPEKYSPIICDTLYKNKYKPTLIYLNLKAETQGKSRKCSVPKMTQDTFTIRGPIVLDDELSTNVQRSFDVNAIDQEAQYILMQSDNYYYHESLGCGFGLLCPSPRTNPITGF
ncbi:hypothetical protein H7X69_02465 [Candidatus Saccharibacteria bacterium]|nr:hypothetical protein [Candidatus Saccharibacteria bacterium]